MAAKKPQLAQSEVVAEMPAACASEAAAIAWFEEKRWGASPSCPHDGCGCTDVYKMMSRDGGREKNFRWRCRGCKKMFSVRTNSIFAETLIPMSKWAQCIWEAGCAKNGISALELSRKLQVGYRSALYMMTRVRFIMRADPNPPKMKGDIECDEVYLGGKPRVRGNNKRGRGTRKQPVVAVLQRGGEVRTRVIPVVNAENLKAMLRDHVDPSARIMTDQEYGYRGIGAEFEGGHHTVDHGRREYVRGDVTTNSVEAFFSRVRRSLTGVYLSVSRQHLHRYLTQAEFLHNTRGLCDGERILELVRRTQGKRIYYKNPKDAA